jgi:tetratricopeptide (TPR) repeat protein
VLPAGVGSRVLIRGRSHHHNGTARASQKSRQAFYENPTTGTGAVAEFRRALNLAPNSTREKLNYALALLKAGKSDEAVDLLKRVQKLHASMPHTWFNLGIYYRKNGDEQLAIEQFRGMLRLIPDEPVAHYQLGALLKQVKDTSGAIAQFERMEELNPLLAGGHFQLYNLYRQAGPPPTRRAS